MSNIQKTRTRLQGLFFLYVFIWEESFTNVIQRVESLRSLKSTKMFSRNLDWIWHVFLAKVREQSHPSLEIPQSKGISAELKPHALTPPSLSHKGGDPRQFPKSVVWGTRSQRHNRTCNNSTSKISNSKSKFSGFSCVRVTLIRILLFFPLPCWTKWPHF